ncbi:MAG: ABC transporter ATP-binding protein [Myxococcota bacterium]
MITVEGLTHYYGERRAIEDIRFTIAKNEIVGFLGLNGAGKSTTLRILAGLLVPSDGAVTIDGVDLVSSGAASRARIGYLPEDPPLYRDMTVREFVEYCGELKGLDGATVRARIDDVLKIAQLTHVQHRVIQELSHGYRKRCGIAQAIIHKPALVILDEPISGLDPRQIVEMRQVIRGLAKDCTVLISSHILGEISETCDRILVLAGGKIVAQGTEAELAARAGADGARLTLLVRGTGEAIEAALASGPAVLRHDKHAEADGIWRVHVSLAADQREELVAALVKGGVGVRKLVEDESELEQIFLGLTQGASA